MAQADARVRRASARLRDHAPRPPRDRWWWLGVALLSAAGVFVALAFRQAGVTWDEGAQHAYGEAVLDFFLSRGRDQSYLGLSNLPLYGPLFDVLVATAGRISPLPIFDTRHLLNGAVWWLALLGTWRLALQSGRTRTAFLALATVMLWPSFLGHAFFNPKDIPFAAGYVWSLHALLLIRRQLPRVRWQTALGATAAIGLTASVRVGGLVLLGFLGAVLLEYVAHQLPDRRHGWAHGLRQLLGPVTASLLIALGAYGLMVATWPWAARDPLRNPVRALHELSHIDAPSSTPFGGQLVSIQDVPWDYVPRLVALKAPELAVVILVVAAVVVVVRSVRRRGAGDSELVVPLTVAVVVPWLIALAQRATLYDEVRHFLFLVPPLAVLTALALEGAWSWLAHRSRWPRIAAASALSAYVVAHVGILAYLHPYQYVYYNAFTGGLPGASGRYELDYWGASLKEAAERFGSFVEAHGGGPVTLFSCGDSTSTAAAPPSVQRVPLQQAQYALALSRPGCPALDRGVPVLSVERFGVVLSEVRRLDAPRIDR